MAPARPQDRRDFKIAIVCAQICESNAVQHCFDHFWDDHGYISGQVENDENTYTTGFIGEHNVALVHMPGTGGLNAASVAALLRISFPEVKLALVVGVCGGVPNPPHHEQEIYLGDLVISTAVVQYDFGAQYDGDFSPRDPLNDVVGRTSRRVRGLLAKLQTDHFVAKMQNSMVKWLATTPGFLARAKYPGLAMDHLYQSRYLHKHSDGTCPECASGYDQVCPQARAASCSSLGCSPSQLVNRGELRDATIDARTDRHRPQIHFGTIGSANTVMKSAVRRDDVAARHKLIALEMEGAGVGDSVASVVIKGVCNYADSHKNEAWQDYAAAVAAAGAKAFLQEWVPVSRPRDYGDHYLNPQLATRSYSTNDTLAHANDEEFVPERRSSRPTTPSYPVPELLTETDDDNDDDGRRSLAVHRGPQSMTPAHRFGGAPTEPDELENQVSRLQLDPYTLHFKGDAQIYEYK